MIAAILNRISTISSANVDMVGVAFMILVVVAPRFAICRALMKASWGPATVTGAL